jgi:hypothetical protein
MNRNRNVSGRIGGGPAIDLISMIERYVYKSPIDENERIYFEDLPIKDISLGSVLISQNTALHKVLHELVYSQCYLCLYDDIDWVDNHHEFSSYVIEMFGHMGLRVPHEFYCKTETGILAAREKYREYFLSGLQRFVNSAFAHLWQRKGFLYDFNMILANEISPLLKSEYPILESDGKLPRAAYFPTWIKDLVMYRERGLCHYCGCIVAHPSVPNQSYDIDHMIPIAGGGTNDPTNLVLSCPKCNNGKRAKYLSVPDTFAWPKIA